LRFARLVQALLFRHIYDRRIHALPPLLASEINLCRR
jgi:hypothetical protein